MSDPAIATGEQDGRAVLARTIRSLPGIRPEAAERMVAVYDGLEMPSAVALEVARAIAAQPLQCVWAFNQGANRRKLLILRAISSSSGTWRGHQQLLRPRGHHQQHERRFHRART